MYPFSFCGYFKIRNQKIKTLTNSGRHLVLRFLQLAIWRCMWQWLEVTEAVELTAVQAGAELFPTSSAIFRPGLRMLYRDHKEFQDIRTWRSTRISQALGRFPYGLPFLWQFFFFRVLLEITSAVTCLSLSVSVVKCRFCQNHWMRKALNFSPYNQRQGKIFHNLTWWLGDSSSYQSAAVTYQAGLFFISWLTVYQGKYWRIQSRLIHLRRLIPRDFGMYSFFLS